VKVPIEKEPAKQPLPTTAEDHALPTKTMTNEQ